MSEETIEKSIKNILWSIVDIVVSVSILALSAWCLCALWGMLPKLFPGIVRVLEMPPSIDFLSAVGLIFFSRTAFSAVFSKRKRFSKVYKKSLNEDK